jgi:hypothetical protein
MDASDVGGKGKEQKGRQAGGSQLPKTWQGVIRKLNERRGAPGIEPDATIERPQLYQQRPQNDANLYTY